MKIAVLVVRSLMGLIFVVFGLNGFLNFIPQPELPQAAGAFMGALAASGYFFPVLKATEVIGGAMLLANRLPALGLVLLAPIVVQIFLFHAVLDSSAQGLGMSIFLLLGEAFLGFSYLNAFKGILQPKIELQ